MGDESVSGLYIITYIFANPIQVAAADNSNRVVSGTTTQPPRISETTLPSSSTTPTTTAPSALSHDGDFICRPISHS